MHRRTAVWSAALVALTVVVSAQPAKNQRVAEAVLPLPDSQRVAATVVEYDGEGDRSVLREGTNDWICVADDPAPGFSVSCHHRSLDQFHHIAYQLEAQGRGAERNVVREREYKAGKLQMPDFAVEYHVRGSSKVNALPITVIGVPFATAKSTGLPTEQHLRRPWIMGEGKVQAHIMLPGN